MDRSPCMLSVGCRVSKSLKDKWQDGWGFWLSSTLASKVKASRDCCRYSLSQPLSSMWPKSPVQLGWRSQQCSPCREQLVAYLVCHRCAEPPARRRWPPANDCPARKWVPTPALPSQCQSPPANSLLTTTIPHSSKPHYAVPHASVRPILQSMQCEDTSFNVMVRPWTALSEQCHIAGNCIYFVQHDFAGSAVSSRCIPIALFLFHDSVSYLNITRAQHACNLCMHWPECMEHVGVVRSRPSKFTCYNRVLS